MREGRWRGQGRSNAHSLPRKVPERACACACAVETR